MDVANMLGDMPNYSIFMINGKMGLANGYNIIMQPKYDIIYPFVGDFAIVENFNKQGVVDKYGNEILSPIYESIKHLNKKQFECYKRYSENYIYDVEKRTFQVEQLQSIYNILNQWNDSIIIEPNIINNDIVSFEYHVDYYTRKYGVYSIKHNRIILHDCDSIKLPSYHNIIIAQKDYKYAIVDYNGKLFTSYNFDSLLYRRDESPIDSGLIEAGKNGKYGFVDTYGNVKIDFKYSSAFPFKAGKAIVEMNGKFGVIDKWDNIIIPFNYSEIEMLDNGTIILLNKDYWSYSYTIYGEPNAVHLKSNTYKHFRFNFQGNPFLVLVDSSSKQGVVKLNGDIILDTKYDRVYHVSAPEQFVVSIKGKYGIVNDKDRIILPIEYDNIIAIQVNDDFYYRVTQMRRFGIVNRNMRIIIPIEYDSIDYLPTYHAFKVKRGNSYAIVNFENQILVPFH